MIKLLRFDGTWLIAEINQIEDAEFGTPDCMLKYPFEISGNCLGPWPTHSDERTVVVRSSDITVIVDPKTFILSEYTKLLALEEKDENPNYDDTLVE